MTGPADPAPPSDAAPPGQGVSRPGLNKGLPPGKPFTAEVPEPALPTVPRAASSRWRRRLAWLPIPLLLLMMVVLWVADLRSAYESAILLLVLNIVCSMLVSFFIAYLVGRSFLVRRTPGLLLLGCGVIAWGSAGLVGVVTSILGSGDRPLDINLFITIHNLCVWCSALGHLAGAVLSVRGKREMRSPGLWLATAYTLTLGAVGLITLLAVAQWTPIFFVQGQGGTLVRLFVLGSAIAMFVISAALLGAVNRGSVSAFIHWYTLALGLVAVGLFGIMIESVHASPLSWAGRAAQFLSGIYMLIAAIVLVRESGAGGLKLESGLNQARYWYWVAIVIVTVAAALRLAFLQALGTRAVFITFYPAVMLASLYGGFRAGLLATVFSGALANYFWMEPAGQLSIKNPDDALSMAIFVPSCLLISWISEAMRRAQARAQQAEAEAKVADERLRAAEALRESEQRHRLLAETMLQGVVHQDADGKIIAMNPAAERILGKTREQFLSSSSIREEHDTIHEDGSPFPDLEHPAMAALRTGQAMRAVVMGVWNAQKEAYRWISIDAVPVFCPAETRPPEVYTVFEDVTERRRTAEALRESEERYHTLFSTMTEGFALHQVLTDGQGRPCDYIFLDVNPAFERLTGLKRAEIIGKRVREVMPATESHWIEGYGRVALTGEPLHAENYAAALDRWYEVFAYRTAPSQFAVVFSDITGRKQAASVLENTLERFYWVLSSMTFGTLLVNEDGRIEFANQAFCDIFRLKESPADLAGLTSSEMLEKIRPAYLNPDEDLAHIVEIVERGLLLQDEEVPMKGGRTFLRDFIPMRLGDRKGGRLWIHKDITERKRAEEALRESEDRYRSLFETLIEGFCIIEVVFDAGGRPVDYRFLEVNPAFERQTGLHNAQGKLMRELAPDHEAHWFETYGKVALTGEPTRFVNEARALDRWFDVSAYRVGGPDSRKVAILFNDISDRKRAEERIQASLGEKEVLLKEIHHRVKNNLQVIASLVDIQTNTLDSPALRGVFQDVRDRVRSMALVHEKLYQSESLARVEFADYTRSLVNYLSRAHANAETSVGLKLDLQPVSLSVEAAVPCGLILNELVTNAFKHAFRGRTSGVIALALQTGLDGQVSLRVSDDGIGLPVGMGWRQSRSLGLRLIHLLAGQLNATVEFLNGGGTDFLMTFKQSQLERSLERKHD